MEIETRYKDSNTGADAAVLLLWETPGKMWKVQLLENLQPTHSAHWIKAGAIITVHEDALHPRPEPRNPR